MKTGETEEEEKETKKEEENRRKNRNRNQENHLENIKKHKYIGRPATKPSVHEEGVHTVGA